jgi:hypothetical protein
VAATYAPIIVNHMLTDSARAWDNLNHATSHRPVLRIGNRTRDNTSTDRGSDDWPIVDAVTTDTGGASSDFTDAAGGTDYRLVATSPAVGASVLGAHNIGSLGRPAGGGKSARGRER